MSVKRYLKIFISEKDIFDNRPFFPTHIAYVAHRFKLDHGATVLNHKLLKCTMHPYAKGFEYVGQIGVAVSDRRQ